MEALRKLLEKDTFAANNGIKLEEVHPGYAKTKIEINENHLNGAGFVQGGVLFTLADFALAAATNSYGKVSLSIEASISFFEKSNSGTIYAEATEISRSNKLITCEIRIFHESGTLLAHFKGTAYVSKYPVPGLE